MKRQLRAGSVLVVVGLCLLALAGCGASAGKGKGPQAAGVGNAGIAAGDAALARGDRGEAGRQYLSALNSGADAATAHTRLGDLYLGMGSYPQARDAYQQAVKANPKYAPALQGIGFALYLGGGREQAGPYLTKALALDPSLSRAAALLGTLENRDGHPDVALAVSDASLAKAFDADVENNRGISLLLLGRGEEAASAFHKAVASKKSVKFSNNLGLALCKLGRYDEAYAAFAGVATESAALNNLGVCYMEAGNKERAQEFFEKAIAANPRFYPQAQDNLSRLSAVEEVTLPAVVATQPASPAGQPAAAPIPVQSAPAVQPARPQGHPLAPAPAPKPAAGSPAASGGAAVGQTAPAAPVAPDTPIVSVAVPSEPAAPAPAPAAPGQSVPTPPRAAKAPGTSAPGMSGQEPKPFGAAVAPAGARPAAAPAEQPKAKPVTKPSAVEKNDRSEMP